MKIAGNTILITGGATGIGFALAEVFVRSGNTVIICGRRKNRLDEAAQKIPGLITRQCDVTKKTEREDLFKWIKATCPGLNILINNAGIQKNIDFANGAGALTKNGDEVQTNLVAPIALSALFTPFLMKKESAAIFNVSSGLGFVPLAFMPVYCATKSALHSFTVSLRHQLHETSVKVFEIIPPAVETELGKNPDGAEENSYHGIKPEVVAAAVLQALEKDEYEIAVGEARGLVEGSRRNFTETFKRLNSW